MNEWAAKYPDRFFSFERAYSNSTTTLLSVPSILTGIAPVQPVSERIKAPLLWQWAKAAKMQSFYFTSHHLDWLGLGDFITTPAPDASWDMRRENLPSYRDMGCDDHYTVERAISHIESLKNAEKPFLGVVHLNTNHYPYTTEPLYQQWSGSDVDLYDNTILETDTHTRRLIETLERTGQLERTVILFASDHGEAFHEHGYTAHFYCHFAETITVPLWVWLPQRFAAQRDLSHLKENRKINIQNLDILPTILDCVGAWENEQLAEHRAAMMGSSLFREIDPKRNILITNTDEIMPSIIGLSSVTGDFHYMLRTSGSSPVEDLYHITNDPQERNNLWPDISDTEKHSYRSKFLPYPVSASMMKKAFPHLSAASNAQPR
jgi:arylsulfatase A-like enzyme